MKNQMINLFALSIIIFVLTGISVTAQQHTIKGIVTTFDSIPLNQASILVKSSKAKVFSDSIGNFQVLCEQNDKLKVTAKGFYTQNIQITPDIKVAMINLKLRPNPNNVKHAIGYGHVKDGDKLNAVVSLRDQQVFAQYKDMFSLLRERFANVDIVNGEVVIRGAFSISSEYSALIIVDGVPMNSASLEGISPDQVKTVNVVKDGSSSIYGSRGANGVIIIELKDGSE